MSVHGAGEVCKDVMRKFDLSGRDNVLSQSGSLQYLLSIYCGFNPPEFEYYMGEGTMGIEEVADMTVYPEKGSIQMIDGKAVVKLAECNSSVTVYFFKIIIQTY